jgi:hypothetical protein
MRTLLAKLRAFFAAAYRRLRVVDWAGAILAILKAVKRDKLKVDPKYIVVKPRILSDENYLRGIAGIQAVLAFIPATSVAAPALGLGAMGFKLWTRISLGRKYEQLEYPPTDPNMLRLSIELDPELGKHYGALVKSHNWTHETMQELEPVYNDFQFITDPQMLKSKYPHVDPEYIDKVASRNRRNMKTRIDNLEQAMIEHSTSPEIEHNIRKAFEYVKEIFPAMNDWALFNSEGFDQILEAIDTIF